MYETSTGFFWKRRDEQLENLIGIRFETVEEKWNNEPDSLFISNKDMISMTEPKNRVAAYMIKSLIPQILFGIKDYDSQKGKLDLVVGLDYNQNMIPDFETEQNISVKFTGECWKGTCPKYTIFARDSAGNKLAELTILNPVFKLYLEEYNSSKVNLESAELDGNISSRVLIEIIISSGGIDEDGTVSLVKNVFGLEMEATLPSSLSVNFVFEFETNT